MTTPSPSEFLTFMRTVSRPASSCLRQSLSARPQIHQSIASRSFASASVRQATSDPKQKEHVTTKNERLDVQSDSSAEAKASRTRGEGGSATTQSDERNSTAKAKKDHPEAPDVVIGMQDERGRKGH
ncbi:hypothetical protein NA57DRAFT_71548 [Rhizodiscina lignyota]|uniref:Uncharacterized protein n=1 Tax=Rhizodiscina lignyota TaxID=1504668 RepID=A0A9P4IN73_9PEZI|nr:hypothetical protein NA57DRAFT_71548 [Rhizodiscina lignyota]